MCEPVVSNVVLTRGANKFGRLYRLLVILTIYSSDTVPHTVWCPFTAA